MNLPILEIITELRLTRSRLAKEQILRSQRSNTEWLDYLKAVYNPFVVYGKSGDKNGGRNNLENLMLCRSIDAGITATTINKIYPDLIPTASKIMKAKDYTNKSTQDISFPVICSVKFDGHYTAIIVSEGKPKFYSSGGHEYTVTGSHPFVDIPDGVYFAERHGRDGKLGQRVYANLRGSRGAQYSIRHFFKIFYYVTLEEYKEGKGKRSYSSTIGFLTDTFRLSDLVQWNLIPNAKELALFLSEVTSMRWEGVVGASPDLLWRDSKSRRADYFKVKKRPTADLLCIGEIEGEGKNQGLIGALLLQDSKGRIVNVGSGLSDDDIHAWGTFIGTVVEIEYEQIINTYIQPVIKHRRPDKGKGDID
jgi:hypothetical protein